MISNKLTRCVAALALIVLTCGCTAVRGGPGTNPGAPAAEAAVESFLRLAGERDYAGMGWVFGTDEGPIMERDDASEIEKRMYALASILYHDTYMISDQMAVPGRTGDAIRFRVLLQRGTNSFRVPFVAVRGPGNRWFVEQVDVEAITAAQ